MIARVGVALVLLGWFAWSTYASLGWSLQARLLPQVVGGLALVLGLLQLVKEFRAAATTGDGLLETLDVPVDDDLQRDELIRRTATAFGWFFGLLAAVWLIGMLASLPLFIMAYVLVQAKVRWSVAALYGVSFLVFLIVVFQQVLRVPFYGGLVGGWLAG